MISANHLHRVGVFFAQQLQHMQIVVLNVEVLCGGDDVYVFLATGTQEEFMFSSTWLVVCMFSLSMYFSNIIRF